MTAVTKKRGEHARNKRDGVLFAALPHALLNSPQYAALSAQAVKLLVDLAAQYVGNNNGDLCASWRVMEKRGWRSRDTLAKALADLIEGGFVAQTRQGGRNRASLYGITCYALDDNPKLDILARDFPRGEYNRRPPLTRGARARGTSTKGPRDTLRVVATQGIATQSGTGKSKSAGVDTLGV